MPSAFRVTLFNDSRNNHESNHLPSFASIIVRTAIEKYDTKSFWHGFTESHFEILYRQQIIDLILKFFRRRNTWPIVNSRFTVHSLPLTCKRLKYILCIISKNLKFKIFKHGTDKLGFGGQIWTLPFINLANQITLK